jgi:HPt (histidine-containing phosphotransfer) domain-containing protein
MGVYVDVADGMKRVMNNAKLYVRLLTKFRDETKLDPIFTAIEAGDWKTAQEQAHTVKGITANLSIKELNEKIVTLEAQLKLKVADASSPDINPADIEAVKAAYAATLPEVEKVIAENA